MRDIREKLSLVSGSTNYSILRVLHDSPMHSGQLSHYVNCERQNIRVHLKRLKDHGFISYDQIGKHHLYHIKTPFESSTHEWILALIAMDDPVQPIKPLEKKPIEHSNPASGVVQAQQEYWTTLVKGIYSILIKQGSLGEQEHVQERLEAIQHRIDRLENLDK